MKKQLIIILILTFLIIGQTVSAQNALWLYFAVNKGGQVILESFDVWPEEYGGIWNQSVSAADAYEVRILDGSGNILNKAYFIPDFLILSDPPIEVDETVVEVVFPHNQNIRTVQVLKGGSQILRVSVGSRLCNQDRICSNDENFVSCPSDCGQYAKDNFCNSTSNDSFCDQDCAWDIQVGGECVNPNCNDGTKNQDETGIDTGGICQQLKCANGIQDSGEEGIDCGGVCQWQCAQDPCGDYICAEYESASTCPVDCVPKSIIKNAGSTALSGYLLMKIQKWNGQFWQDYQAPVVDEYTPKIARAIQPGQTLDLKTIWNSQNYKAQERGTFRIYAALLSATGSVTLSDTWQFNVQ